MQYQLLSNQAIPFLIPLLQILICLLHYHVSIYWPTHTKTKLIIENTATFIYLVSIFYATLLIVYGLAFSITWQGHNGLLSLENKNMRAFALGLLLILLNLLFLLFAAWVKSTFSYILIQVLTSVSNIMITIVTAYKLVWFIIDSKSKITTNLLPILDTAQLSTDTFELILCFIMTAIVFFILDKYKIN